MNAAGNASNHPETMGPDTHMAGSPLPRAHFTNSVGYLPDGTPMNAAGNAVNHPETMGPDLHMNGSPLPAPLKGYIMLLAISLTALQWTRLVTEVTINVVENIE